MMLIINIIFFINVAFEKSKKLTKTSRTDSTINSKNNITATLLS